MSIENIFDLEKNYKSYYSFIFSYFYFWEGVHQAIPAILPYYLLFVFGSYNIALLAIIGFYALLPWSLKVLVGLANDKWGSEKWGRRFPFIFYFGILAGITWILMTYLLPLDETIYTYLMFYLLIANIGMAFADTSLDGLILDVTPKNKLAKVQGYTWTMLMVGGAGAAGLGLVFYWMGIVPLLFLITGINLSISCIITHFIKEPPIVKNPEVFKDLKRIATERKNWKVFGWTLITAMGYPLIMGAFYYFMLITMGIIDVKEATLSLEAGQTTDAFIIINILIAGFSGLGIIIGSLLMGWVADKSRRKATNLTYAIYLPICIISNFFVGFILGYTAQIIFGFIYGSITIVGQTIRGDIAKKNFPDLKSTYYALLISFSNLGQSFGSLILAFMFAQVAPIISDFFTLYFIITIMSSIIVIISYLMFRTIDPEEYEFSELLEEEAKTKILICPTCGSHINEGTTFCVDCGKDIDK
ncbi:MAG: MFS transporter [Promethearchaeia archaeon]